MTAPSRSDRNSNIARIVKGLLALSERTQGQLADALELSDSAMSRKLSRGTWNVDDLDVLARFFAVPMSTFFRDPTDLFGGSDQQNERIIWETVTDQVVSVDKAAA